MMLTDQQWKQIEDLFPAPPRRKDGRGRPWASNRSCFEGILWVLRVGARWRDLPSEYPNGSTCWRRLRRWEEQGVWLRAWQALLARLDERKCSTGKRPFSTRPLCWRKRGLRSRKNPSRERYEVHGGGRRPGYTYRSATCVRADLRVPARGKHAGAGKSTARWTRPPAEAVAPCDCGSRLRFGWAAPAVVGSRHGVDRSLLAHQKTAPL